MQPKYCPACGYDEIKQMPNILIDNLFVCGECEMEFVVQFESELRHELRRTTQGGQFLSRLHNK